MSQGRNIRRLNAGKAGRKFARPTGHAHKLVLETARGMAEAMFEELIKKDGWLEMFARFFPPEERDRLTEDLMREAYVKKTAPHLLPEARAAIANSIPFLSTDELKAEAYDALLLDATLVKRRPGQAAASPLVPTTGEMQ